MVDIYTVGMYIGIGAGIYAVLWIFLGAMASGKPTPLKDEILYGSIWIAGISFVTFIIHMAIIGIGNEA